ncbi:MULTISPECIES: lytic murein transglycosylase [unclassified Mesorhizobium]|uniref:lytic murein transglycosylase n=1 Tax=unclassified Mesorhizobium TaxID=325217 RepID=UPI000FCBCD85|nr:MULTISPECIES: lytic murein transglycosylase [unclassified Mesorhizobium]RUU11810.1 lytic murein transglycosylase [Mesorhizobium sp. M7A.T.Ca.TU.009.01.3.2]AZV20267.1 lytic murein transglycosylase [Mesorhizobium sp. M7A.F.Ce.TU.012.03.2.1]MCQ8870685.1 lytic murein transglycosylase [Mesorhizobium sp. LMG17149]RUU85759.1 lytic murein transglycosylase [Mesorhizobium sp. M7A.F.Ca.MR.176.00.0.0]RUV36351.1 lytic murein transglycosylase [Mesorhizobium sp. M7A.F.Ca.MR.148.00.0.0]
MSVRNAAKIFTSVMAAASLSLALLMPGPAFADAGFRQWVAGFRATAVQSGVSGALYDQAFRNIRDIDPVVLEKARTQPEFTAPAWDYFDNRVHDQSVAVGQQMARKWKPWLDRIEARFGVNRYILLAIWSMESNYGEILKRDDVMRNVVRSLATLAYADPKRAKFARTQLVAALKILQTGDIDESHLSGSWAGAMGHTQFIPTSYLHYAVDMDGNGKRDIWNSIPDALATSANLLKKNGWQAGKTWGYEVALPAGKLPGGSKTLSQWQALGVVRANGKPFKNGSDKATLKVPDGRNGPAFLMIKNFTVIKAYNNADKYALAVGLLADEIAGSSGLVQDWKRPFTKLTFEERQELQQRLSQHGLYDGKFDGKIGDGSKSAILAFQAKAGLTQDGYPSMEVLKWLRQK